ncbi:MAG TPA: tRNA (N6-isopentenyl adenosine(37)-C2)-methylthiotransferase MiaB [Bacteroidales bacterium]|nr:tRNA (N6-isopentenyl adenosine(37)-C2)-methylthiotransferase MiaB [Bacteroidales bacterium]
MQQKKVYIETYGCQMNVADSELVAAMLPDQKFAISASIENADVIIINTCSVREHAEKKIWNRLQHIHGLKRKNKQLVTGVIGCMAQRLGEEILNHKTVDFVAGPDAYRSISGLIEKALQGKKESDTHFSIDENYHNILPKRSDINHISGFISITRGCNNFCSYCIVPYTRGRERSRDYTDILSQAEDLSKNQYREIYLLGQNVNSYQNNNLNFSALLSLIADSYPDMRIRFTTSHPKDLTDELIEVIAKYKNICNHIHLPVQSGSNRILKLMNRRYSREWYLSRVEKIRELIPGCGLSTDIFCGFCGETEDDHAETLELLRRVRFDSAFMFKYSGRPGTLAAEKMADDIPEELKIKRLNELISLQNKISLQSNKNDIGKLFEVLIENESKRSKDYFSGRTETNKTVVFEKDQTQIGQFVTVMITDASSATLKGKIINHG